MAARPITYPPGCSVGDKRKIKQKTLGKYKDKLFYDTKCDCEKCNFILQASNKEKWLAAINERYKVIEEKELISKILKLEDGSICVYDSGKIVIYGKGLMERFEKDVEEGVLEKLMKKLKIKPKEESPGEAEDKDAVHATAKK